MIYSSHIYELNNWAPRKRDQQSDFQGKFFRKAILAGIKYFKIEPVGNTDVEILQFFTPIKAAQRTMVIVSSAQENFLSESDARGVLGQIVGPTEKIYVSRVIWQQGAVLDCREISSQFLRGSSSLTEKSFEEKDNLFYAAEGHGVAIIETTQRPAPPHDRFARLSQATALTHAYRSVLNEVIENLSSVALSGKQQSEKELRKWSEFMAAAYFAEPINLSTIEISTLYRAVSESQKIDFHAKEVTEQMRLFAELVRLDRTEDQDKREKKLLFNFNIIYGFGVFLTLLSLSQATQVTPKIVADFRAQWTSCFRQFGASCLIGGYEDKPIPPTTLPIRKVSQKVRPTDINKIEKPFDAQSKESNKTSTAPARPHEK